MTDDSLEHDLEELMDADPVQFVGDDSISSGMEPGSPTDPEVYGTIDLQDMNTLRKTFQSAPTGIKQMAAEKMKERAMQQTWRQIRKLGQQSELKQVNVAKDDDFIDTMYRIGHALEQQAIGPCEVLVFTAPETRHDLMDWMDQSVNRDSRFPITDTTSAHCEVAGFQFQFATTKHLKDGEAVVGKEELLSAPTHEGFAYVDRLPLGVEIRLEVDGVDNELIIE